MSYKKTQLNKLVFKLPADKVKILNSILLEAAIAHIACEDPLEYKHILRRHRNANIGIVKKILDHLLTIDRDTFDLASKQLCADVSTIDTKPPVKSKFVQPWVNSESFGPTLGYIGQNRNCQVPIPICITE